LSPSDSFDWATDDSDDNTDWYAGAGVPYTTVDAAESTACNLELAAATESEYAASTELNISSWTGFGSPEICAETTDRACEYCSLALDRAAL